MNAIGYIRVSTDEQAQSGAGLDAQRAAILSESIRRGWTIVRIIEDAGLSGKTMSRPGLEEAITMFRAGEADVGEVSSPSDRDLVTACLGSL